jgi:CRP-like cAMP-binding protein
MALDDFLDSYRRVPLFAECTKKDLRTVARQAEKVRAEPGRVLVTEGQLGREFFMIVTGTARVTRNGRKVATLGPGESFGELALLDGGARNATVVAETPMELLVLTRPAFVKLLDELPGFGATLLRGVARRLQQADARAVD